MILVGPFQLGIFYNSINAFRRHWYFVQTEAGEMKEKKGNERGKERGKERRKGRK